MSTIDEVRAAEKRVKELVNALKNASATDPEHLTERLQKATDDYAKAVRELNQRWLSHRVQKPPKRYDFPKNCWRHLLPTAQTDHLVRAALAFWPPITRAQEILVATGSLGLLRVGRRSNQLNYAPVFKSVPYN